MLLNIFFVILLALWPLILDWLVLVVELVTTHQAGMNPNA